MKPVLSVLSDSEIEVICNAARLILSKKGLRFVDPEVLDVFRRNGFEIADGNVVHIASDQLESALRTAPKRFVRRGASVDRDVALGTGVTHFAVGSLPIFVVERKPAVRRRPAELGDLKRFTQLSEALDAFTIGNPVVQPQEIPEKVMHLLWNRTGSVRMTKPVCCWYGTSRETSEEGLEVLRLAAGGLEQLRAQKRWAITVCPDSALQWGKSAIGVVVMAPADVPVEVIPRSLTHAFPRLNPSGDHGWRSSAVSSRSSRGRGVDAVGTPRLPSAVRGILWRDHGHGYGHTCFRHT